MRFGRKQVVAIVTATIIVLAIGAMYVISMPNTTAIENNIKSLYQLSNPGSMVEVVSMAEDSGLYKAVVKVIGPSGTQFAETWVTKDGKYLTQNVILVQGSISQITAEKDFIDCLYSKGLRIYGVTNQSTQAGVATLMQLNALGIYSPKIFVSCDGDLLPNCLTAGISQAPTTVYGNKTYTGVLTVGQLGNVTACKSG